MTESEFFALAQESLHFFIFTMAELAFLFVGISALVGLVQEFLPQDKVKKLLSGRHGKGYLLGALFGGLTPFCSCSTIPVTLGLLKAGAGFGPTMAFLFTSPLVNPIIIPLFFTILGPKITLVYGGVAVTMAIVISFLLERAGFQRFVREEMVTAGSMVQTTIRPMSPAPAPQSLSLQTLPNLKPMLAMTSGQTSSGIGGCCSGRATTPKDSRLRRVVKEAVRQYRNMFPFIVIGVSIGAVIHGFMPADLVAAVAGADNPLAIPVAAVVGIPLYIRVSTMIPIAASLIAKGMSYGAVVALTIGGAGASLPELAMLKGVFRLPLLLAFIGAVLTIAITTGLLVNMVMV